MRKNLSAALPQLQRMSLLLLLLLLCGAKPRFPIGDPPCDSTGVRGPDFGSDVQVGVRSELHGDTCLYVYTILNGSPDTLTYFQVGVDQDKKACEFTGAPPHAPPDTAYAPHGWVIGPKQLEDPEAFAIDCSPANGGRDTRGILPGTLLTGFSVALPRPDAIYERPHWAAFMRRFSWMAYVGQVRSEDEMNLNNGQTGSISGTVTDASGRAVPNPSIFLRGAPRPSESKSDGTYLISAVPIGRATLVARTTGYYPCEQARITVRPDATARVDLRLAAWPAVASASTKKGGSSKKSSGTSASSEGPCAPYVTDRDQLKVRFPEGVIDTTGARFLKEREPIPPRVPGDSAASHLFIYGLAQDRVSFVLPGVGDDTARVAFKADIFRSFRDSDEERLIRIAEETYPPPEAVLAAGESPGNRAPSKQPRLWWYGDFDGVRLPYAITMDAVRYYLNLTQTLGQGKPPVPGGIKMKRSTFRYSATISSRPQTISRDGRVFRDAFVVTMKLSWSDYCGSLCACWFDLERTVVLRRDGTVLCVFGDQRPMVTVS